MKQVLFGDILPFVRYFHTVGQVSTLYATSTVIPYDHRLFFLRRGSCRILLEEETVTLCPTDLLYIPAGHAYRLSSCDPESDLVAVNFDFFREHAHMLTPIPPAVRERFVPNGIMEELLFADAPALNGYLLLRHQGELLELFRRMEEETAGQRLYCDEYSSSYLRLILSHVARVSRAGSDAGGGRVVDEVIALVRQCYAQPITNQEIAQRLNYHPNYLNRLMLQHTGRTLHQYLLHYRFDQAISLLTMTDLSVAEVAARAGFADVSHFSRLFRKLTGQSPGRFRAAQINSNQ